VGLKLRVHAHVKWQDISQQIAGHLQANIRSNAI